MIVDESIALLRQLGVTLDKGLTPREMRRIERWFGFKFSPDHRDFLSKVLPVGKAWPPWRNLDSERLRDQLEWPFEGVLFDVEANSFWPQSWGVRPESKEARGRVTYEQMGTWPRLVPVYGHRYMPAAPAGPGAPVLSVHQTDVISYGDNLLEYVKIEFCHEKYWTELGPHEVEPWLRASYGLDVD